MSGWELAVWLRPDLHATLPVAWDVWGGPSVVLGATFGLTTLILSIADLLQPTHYGTCLVSKTKTRHRPSGRQMLTMLPVILQNGLVSAAMIYVMWNLRLAVHPGSLAAPWRVWISDRLGLSEWRAVEILQVAAINWLSQLWFFYVHRWVHSHATVYKFVHAMHHQHTEPFALTAVHCTISEQLLLNTPAVLIGQLIVVPSWWAHCIWMFLAATYTPIAHSGHNFGVWGLYDGQFHDDHHRLVRVNFGSNTLDRRYGTHADQFRET